MTFQKTLLAVGLIAGGVVLLIGKPHIHYVRPLPEVRDDCTALVGFDKLFCTPHVIRTAAPERYELLWGDRRE